ncbi:MAG: FG-GAP-like repeat-containing protein [Bacteroidia bacterium]
MESQFQDDLRLKTHSFLLDSLVTVCLLLFTASYSFGQNFSELADSLGVIDYSEGVYGSGLSTYDWNKDGFDDIVLLKKDSIPSFYENTGAGFNKVSFEGIEISNQITSVCWVDINNDGFPDISFNSFGGGPTLYLNLGDFTFENITDAAGIRHLPIDLGFGHSWGDYNNDGFLDLFVVNYNVQSADTAYNYLYKNNGDLTFSNVTQQAGLHQEMEPTFVGVWADYNNDNKSDLFILNDRFAWRNFLYENTGNENFVERGVQANMDDFMDSMSGTIGDFNNDGNFDIYITNTAGSGNKLFRNNQNGTFADVAAGLNVQMFQGSWGASFLDYDNDGWEDLFVVTQSLFGNSPPGYHFLFKNYQGIFDLQTNNGIYGSTGYTYSTAKGDLNNDGYVDIITHSKLPLGTEVWMNDASAGANYLKLRLEGVISNRDAVGCRLELATSLGKQFRYTISGDQFLSQNSQWQIFGLREAQIVDSLKITWPSGHIDVFYDLNVNQSLTILEGSSIINQITVNEGTLQFCSGDSVTLDAGEWDSYLWSNGDTSRFTTVYSSDTINVQVFNGTFNISSDELIIKEFTNPILDAIWQGPLCSNSNDGFISLNLDSLSLINSIIWSNDSESEHLQSLGPGFYEVFVNHDQSCNSLAQFVLESPPIFLIDSLQLVLTEANDSCQYTYSSYPFIQGGAEPYTLIWEIFNAATNEFIFSVEEDSLTCLSPSQAYKIVLSAIDSNSCTAYFELLTESITSLSFNLAFEELEAFPNPSGDRLSIRNISFRSSIVMQDALGRIVLTDEMSDFSNQKTLSLEYLPSGVYFISVFNGKSHQHIRVQKK